MAIMKMKVLVWRTYTVKFVSKSSMGNTIYCPSHITSGRPVMERITEKTSCSAAADLSGNFFSYGHKTGWIHAVTSCFLSQPRPSVSCGYLEMTYRSLRDI